MRLALALAFVFALTSPAIAAPTPVPAATRAATIPAAKAPADLADQVAGAIRSLEQSAAQDQAFYRHFAFSVYSPVCAAHKGLSTDPKVPAVTWIHHGEAFPAMVKCADGYGKSVTGP